MIDFFDFKGSINKGSSYLMAHRGLSSKYPENTMVAFENSLRCADLLEFDVSLTKDNELVVIHDRTVNRTTNKKGAVNKFTMLDLNDLDAGSWFDPKFSSERIPSLDDVFNRFKNKIKFAVEIKELKDKTLRKFVAEKCISLVEKYELENEVIFLSFDHEILKIIKDLKPHLHICLSFLGIKKFANRLDEQNRLVEYIKKNGASTAIFNSRLLHKSFVSNLKRNGLKVAIYTIDSVKLAQKYIDMGVDIICTNKPDLLKKNLPLLK